MAGVGIREVAEVRATSQLKPEIEAQKVAAGKLQLSVKASGVIPASLLLSMLTGKGFQYGLQ